MELHLLSSSGRWGIWFLKSEKSFDFSLRDPWGSRLSSWQDHLLHDRQNSWALVGMQFPRASFPPQA